MKYLIRKKGKSIFTQKKSLIILCSVMIFFSVSLIRFSILLENATQENFMFSEIDNKSSEKLKNSLGLDSPLLWYSQTGYGVQSLAISSAFSSISSSLGWVSSSSSS